MYVQIQTGEGSAVVRAIAAAHSGLGGGNESLRALALWAPTTPANALRLLLPPAVHDAVQRHERDERERDERDERRENERSLFCSVLTLF